MAKAGDQYTFRTGNIWNFANRNDLKTVKRLVSEGIAPTLRNKVGWTPLHAAAFGGAEKVLKYLLKRPEYSINDGFGPDVVDKSGRTPLADAARAGHLKCVKLLVKAGAEVDESIVALAKGSAVRDRLRQVLQRKHKDSQETNSNEELDEDCDPRVLEWRKKQKKRK